MRFFADGPSIPNDLIEARNNGDVVFFCGAGVSMTAGLPSFLRLTEQIVDELGVPNASAIRSTLESSKGGLPGGISLDRLIGRLQGEYGPAAVERAVIKAIKTKGSPDGSAHQDLLALSRTRAGHSRLVTTNFDTLFERGARSLNRHIAPFLPDLSSGIPLDGLIYLHGRIDPRPRDAAASQNLIIGSADYGRAYLSNGWALRFVKEMLNRYVVVLVGYSAEDPPISYLLEGLNGDGTVGRMSIYAFSDGEAAEVRARWKDRGVTAIPYDKLDQGHSGLWRSIAAWAELARDPDGWRAKTIALAQHSPRMLPPHERGQVAAVISSSEGAKAFADSEPPPLAEWLSVFDPVVRYGRPWVPDYTKRDEKIDPLFDYGLDDDPPRPLGEEGRPSISGVNLLAPLSSADREPSHVALGGRAASEPEALPPRLWHLARWIGRTVDQPASLWWASRHIDLHRRLKDQIEFLLSRNDPPLPASLLLGWRLLLEGMEVQDHPWNLDTMDIEADVRRHGWTERHLRAFVRFARPRIRIEADALRPGRPPEKTSSAVELHDLITAKPHFEKWHNALPPAPHNVLPRIIAALRAGLVEAAGILHELGHRYYRTPDLHFEGDPADRMVSELGEHILWFIRVFEDLRQRLPKTARHEAQSWPTSEPYIFDKLRIWSAIHPDLFSGGEGADIILELSDAAFWDAHQARELLWTLRARWASIPKAKRAAIERRIIKGRPRRPNETLKEFREDRASTSAARLAWLDLHGCSLSLTGTTAVPRLKAKDPNWREAWGRNADMSFEGSIHRVETETDFSAVDAKRFSDLAAAFRQQTQRLHGEGIDRRPFQGLVKDNPSRALAVIAFEARAGRPAPDLWQELLSSWPPKQKPRLVRLVALRLTKLDQVSIRQLGHAALRWMETNLPPLHDAGVEPWSIHDALADAYLTAEPAALKSNLIGSSYGGQPRRRSKRTLNYAANAPVGILTDTLLKLLPKKSAKGARLPAEFTQRASSLLNAPAEGRDHAICTLCRHFTYFDHVDPRWTKENLLPLFQVDGPDAESAWNGLAFHARLPRKPTFAAMKPDFLKALVALNDWAWDDGPERIMAQLLLLTTIHPAVGSGDVTPAEAREALQNTTEDVRRSCLWRLRQEIKKPGGWTKFGAPFAQRVWPRERRYQTPSISRTWADVAVAAEQDFADAVKTIIPLLSPVKELDTLLLGLDREAPDDRKLPERFPDPSLALIDALLPDRVERLPYGLGPFLERLAAADSNLRQDRRWRRLAKLLAG
jgi:hypothetical protein